MAQDPSSVEQAVSRAVRDNLASLQRVGEELTQSLADLTAACSSSRPTNALPAMLRAQTAAASLAASIEVLARFIAGSMQPISRAAAVEAAVIPMPVAPAVPAVGSTVAESAGDAGREMGSEGGPTPMVVEMPPVPRVPEPEPIREPEPMRASAPAAGGPFDIKQLSTDEQELHRRANRVAKVSMQDIKMLRPDDVKAGREKKDLCARLRQDLDKARKEYERRFRSILDHPVDYFYDWAVDVLADGDASALGDYPYPLAGAARR